MVTVAMAFSAYSFAAPPNDNHANQNGMAQQPTNDYWQAPNWPNGNAVPAYNSAPPENAQPPAWNNDYRAPSYYGQVYPSNNYPVQNNDQPEMNQSNWNRGAPPQPMQNAYRGNPYPPQRGPYPRANRYQYHPDNGEAAYNHPGYRPYAHNNAWSNNRQNDQFWGNSEPNHWANPNKGNMRQGWNDMIDGPGRMGEMSGGWRAPQFSTPNPVGMGDQVQDNVGNLPEQMRDRHRGNN